jgi:hypothetical protein
MAINRVGLLSPCASDGAPFKEAINGHNAASLGISLPELGSRNTLSAFALMGLTPPSGSVHQCGQPLFDQIQRALTRLVVLPNDQQLLARRNIVAWSHVSHADIADIQALHNREAKKPGVFDDTSTHVRLSLPSDFDGLWLAPEGKEANWIPRAGQSLVCLFPLLLADRSLFRPIMGVAGAKG